MTAHSTAKLYTAEILALAVELADYPIGTTGLPITEVRSRSCGSTLSLGLTTNGQGRISQIGLKVSACAIGQASAAIFAKHAIGSGLREIDNCIAGLYDWLSGCGQLPDWPRLSLLSDARAFPGRHEAILLPWKAAREALCNSLPSG
ncbi:MAG: iron-sulfur cluster assembly scaffold protein [Pontixanthobacter sp.]